MFCSPIQMIWDLTIHPLEGPASSLVHCQGSDFDTICNNPSSLLTDVVCYDSLGIAVRLMILQRDYRERLPHPYKECFVPLSKWRGISQCTPLGGLASSLTHRSMLGSDTNCKSPCLTNIVRFDTYHYQFTVLKRIY